MRCSQLLMLSCRGALVPFFTFGPPSKATENEYYYHSRPREKKNETVKPNIYPRGWHHRHVSNTLSARDLLSCLFLTSQFRHGDGTAWNMVRENPDRDVSTLPLIVSHTRSYTTGSTRGGVVDRWVKATLDTECNATISDQVVTFFSKSLIVDI